ncbi:hypothetical protein [Caulobacter mirabilis]|uniref:DUF885 domain-containing protein n=1 Tax=Caulobacter mirabilis TaxID=69666 RepID=A0A2D2ATX1_9CAUL|nr:hypothetical protein [Caulobacter mirabilis]ATQ41446.1 hypothetical protein CSW64_02950 [Caulobacter mirabilis]
MIRRLAVSLFAAASVLATPVLAKSSLDPIAEQYVKLSLRIGEHEEGYIDAFYGPAEWQAAAKGDKTPLPKLQAEVAALEAALAAAGKQTDPMEARRAEFLRGQLKAAETRLRMMQGEKLSFEDEAEGLFGVRPKLKPLASYDPVLADIEKLVPGDGPLWQRVDSFNERFVIPADKLRPVFDAAIAECRKRTVAHIKLPANERFTLEFVTGKSWSGYNWYKGDAHSLIQVNTDLPVRLSRAVDLGCHEGYPGHHVYNLLLEEHLSKGKGWVEFTVYPLYSPQSLLAEGSANYGIDLAFPGEERLTFETSVLYPLAGLDAQDAGRFLGLLEAQKKLAGSRFTIAAEYLSGRIDREAAIALTQKYGLVSRKRAEQTVSFSEQYRSYVINYGLGQDMVREHVERAGPSQAARWKRMEHLLSEPTVPADLAQ